MNKKELLVKFIRTIRRNKLLTLFIKNIFDYEEIHDYNYIFRIKEEKDRVVIDIFDNISKNRFNRYVFIFGDTDIDVIKNMNNDVFITYIGINNVKDSDNKLLKFAYLFKIDDDKMIKYAYSFLDESIIKLLKKIS